MRSFLTRSRVSWTIGTLIVVVPSSGCLIPIYHQPQGFSSSYYRNLQEVSAAPPPVITAPLGVPTPVPSAPVSVPPAMPLNEPLESLPGPLPPKPVEKPANASIGNWWSWIRRPVTFRSNRTEPAVPADDSSDNSDD